MINIISLRQVREKSVPYMQKAIHIPEDIVELLERALDLSNRSEELMGMLSLDIKNKVSGLHIIATGTVDKTLCSPREVFKHALLNNARSVILFHNHPSGELTPSKDDIYLTERMIECGKILCIEVLDHIVVSDNDFLSMKGEGLCEFD
jgi:DNA repair protein RadC